MRVLNVVSSPRGAESASIAIADAFLDAYCREHPRVEIDTLDVWTEDLPDFDGEAIGAKYKGVSGATMDEAEAEIWTKIQALVQNDDDDGPTPASHFDHQSQFLTFWLGFIGITDVHTMVVERTWGDTGLERLASAQAQAAALARTF